MADELCLIRGGGDLATGVAWRLSRAGLPVVVPELPHPLTVRRAVALSTAVTDGTVDVEGMIGRLARRPDEAVHIAFGGDIGVLVSRVCVRTTMTTSPALRKNGINSKTLGLTMNYSCFCKHEKDKYEANKKEEIVWRVNDAKVVFGTLRKTREKNQEMKKRLGIFQEEHTNQKC